MDVQGLVTAISTAFEDASKLVVRIRDQRVDTDQALPIDATGDLLESLELGRIAVKGQFDREHRRWAERYVLDDIQVREQLKDVLIALQMQVVNVLRTVYMDETDVDFNALQDASDDCRVNAVVCLGQLSQRLSNQARAMPVAMSQPQLSTPQHSLPAMHPASATRSSSSLAHSPVKLRDPFNNLSLAPDDTPRQAAALPRTPDHDDVASLRRPSSATLSPEDVELLCRSPSAPLADRPSMHLPGSNGLDRASYVSSNTNNGNASPPLPPLPPMSPLSWTPQPHPREGYTYGDANGGGGGAVQQSSGYDNRLDGTFSNDIASNSFSFRMLQQTPSTMDHMNHHDAGQPVQLMPQSQNCMPDPCVSSPTLQAPYLPPRSQARQDPTGNMPRGATYRIFPPSISTMHQPEMPQRAPSGDISPFPQPPSNNPVLSPAPTSPATLLINTALTASSPFSPTAPPPQQPQLFNISSHPNISLNLPTEKAPQGFCKGAVRLFLQNGVSDKAFSVAYRPVGMHNRLPYWRCESCKFEGPATTQINTTSSSRRKKGKQETVFDYRIRVRAGGGVRYKWIFLAKSHCPLRSQVDTSTAAKAGEIGAFQCLFCLAEGTARGWTTSTATATNGGGGGGGADGNASIYSNSTSTSTSTSTSSTTTTTTTTTAADRFKGRVSVPVFGNVQMYLDHLNQTHRHEDGWPGQEMLGRMKCIAGRVATGDEEWDINFMPIRDGEEWPAGAAAGRGGGGGGGSGGSYSSIVQSYMH